MRMWPVVVSAEQEIVALKLALLERDEALAARDKALRIEREQREALSGELRVTRAERDLLKERLNKFLRQLFAARSESLGNQKELFFNEAEAEGAASQPAEEDVGDQLTIDVPAHQRKGTRGRKPLDAGLPREVIRHELPQDQRVCPHDGSVLQEIGVEASEQLDIVPQQVRVIRHERVKYACPCCEGSIKLAVRPAQVIPRGLLTEAAQAWVVTAKYDDGMPLYRIAALMGRFGGNLNRNTLACGVVRLGLAVQPLFNLLKDRLLESPVVYGDETQLQVLKEPGRAAHSKSWLWAQGTERSGAEGTGPPIRLFTYTQGRSAQAGVGIWAGMREGAVLMSDGYEVYDQVTQAQRLTHLACWAHCRRYWMDALQALPKAARTREQPASQALELIATLYEVEKRTREMPPQQRQLLRQQDSTLVLAKIQALVQQHQHAVLPQSALGKALHYTASQWPKLTRYVQDGRWPIDNNACENAIRPFVIGRKGWLFADTQAGAQASANLYSLLQTCRVNGVNTYDYLKALFVALPAALTADDYEALLPWRIKLV
jgi:transposase